MIGYILMALGGYLVLEDILKKRGKKNAKLSKNGSDRNSGDRSGGQHPVSETNHGGGGLKKPAKILPAKGNDDVQEPIQSDKSDPVGGGPGDDSRREPGPATEIDDQSEGINNGLEINSENVPGDDGGDVPGESSGGDESDRPPDS
jgi:hypothetical protein